MTARIVSPSRFGVALAAIAALAAAFLGLAPSAPAHAHDTLVATDPAADATIEGLPAEITLTYSAELLGGGEANTVEVTDAAGTLLSDGPAVVDGVNVVQSLTGDVEGAIHVVWRVVSSDGHPISGEYDFTVTAPAAAPSATPTESSTPSTAPAETEEPAASASPVPSDAPAEESGSVIPWIVLGIAVVAAGGAVVYLLVSRARRSAAGSEPGADR